MARINLRPWREDRRRERQQQLAGMLIGVAVLAAVLVFAANWWMNQRIEYQLERNNRLTQEIAKLDKQIEGIKGLEETRASLKASIEVINGLQNNRAAAVKLVDQLARTVPDGLYLTSVSQSGDVVTIEGIAESNSVISEYQRDVGKSDIFYTTSLQLTEAVDKEGVGRVVRFVLKATTKKPEVQTEQSFEEQAVGP